MKENIIVEKSFDFAVRIVNLYKHITNNKKRIYSLKTIITQRYQHWGECNRGTKRSK